VITNFKVGTDHLHLAGYGTSVAPILTTSAGTAINLNDGTRVSLVGVHTTNSSQLFN
jgi:hypothetical protein